MGIYVYTAFGLIYSLVHLSQVTIYITGPLERMPVTRSSGLNVTETPQGCQAVRLCVAYNESNCFQLSIYAHNTIEKVRLNLDRSSLFFRQDRNCVQPCCIVWINLNEHTELCSFFVK